MCFDFHLKAYTREMVLNGDAEILTKDAAGYFLYSPCFLDGTPLGRLGY